jgi:hypothetical protein
MLMGLVGMVMMFTMVMLGFRQARRKQEFVHAERLQALGMGIPLGAQSAWPAAVCIAIGAFVPVCALVVALIASVSPWRSNLPPSAEYLPFHEQVILQHEQARTVFLATVWGTSSTVGVAGVIAASVLAWRLLSHKPRIESDAVVSPSSRKPAFDPDAFDTVGRRG